MNDLEKLIEAANETGVQKERNRILLILKDIIKGIKTQEELELTASILSKI